MLLVFGLPEWYTHQAVSLVSFCCVGFLYSTEIASSTRLDREGGQWECMRYRKEIEFDFFLSSRGIMYNT